MELQIENYKEKHEYISKNGIRSVVYLMDCLDGLKQIPEKYFELAIVDPPYGININMNAGRKKDTKCKKRTIKKWDANIPSEPYWDNLFKKTTNQIIWGGNYFLEYLISTKCFLIWDKKIAADVSFASCEFAWTSFNSVAKTFYYAPMQQKDRFHPTQKPVALYEWIIKNYAQSNDKILDTHLGSGSSRIAAHKANLPFMGFELDKEYFDASVKRFNDYVKQGILF